MFLLPVDYWEVKTTAHKGRGVFAKKDIGPGLVIADYIGRVIKTAEEDTTEKDGQLYLMYYHDRASIFPDLDKPGAHLLNHSCTPNTWITTYKGHNIFFTLRHIFAGEELTTSYLLSPQDDICKDECTHQCHCGSPFCTHSMHMNHKRYEAWNDYEVEQMDKTKRQRIRYGKDLPMLPDYPKTIPDHPVFILFGNDGQAPEVIQTKKLPAVSELRKLIRKTGKTLYFPKDNLHIFGIADDQIIAEKPHTALQAE
jgi:hypothetical protein